MTARAFALAATAALALAGCSSSTAAPAPPGPRATAVFAGGCFWSMEKDFDHLPGVVDTTDGYSGGHTRSPSYEQVSAGDTGHLEVVKVTYDPSRVSYQQLVRYELRHSEVTDAAGQFCDKGPEYRSAIFVADANQRRIAAAEIALAQRQLGQNVVTQILPAAPFWRAEEYHQDYYRKNPVRYNLYRQGCGKDARLAELWRGRG
ncbi:peptide-methionine (S)-S-oxide reductase [Sphingomonas ginkgonis]|uniref:Peptide methionine sulfoxide reductase MsrA n=1 Tax=Sphingomonas ginkgonis TaxID=2315330 RepID=A0A429VBW3_9SPHN|nr:peptide-methionine (S)-S-oxide reductase MsrA [Sphingomonas ginkgonis]RST31366.1 peptide-methionine (S)-S-oxide reductase [Sphingomonas ginkgonis]